MNKINRLLQFFSLFILFLAMITSCTPSTEASKGSLNGTINLEGETDHSGITIALYDLAILDPTIVSINQEYPQIGVHISQHTEFDHRLQSPVKSIETQAGGSFELKKISTGKYNLVAIKDGWGFKYLYNVDISKGDNELDQQINLYEEIHISGNIQGSVTVETDHHLIIDDHTVFLPNTSSLIIHPGAVIRVNPGVDLTIHSAFTAQGEENNMLWMTSNDGFSQDVIYNNLNRDEIELSNSLTLSNYTSVSDGLIQWGKFNYGTSINTDINQIDFKNNIIQNSLAGITIEGDEWLISNNLCGNISVHKAINVNNAQNVLIEDNILVNCYFGIELNNTTNGIINNNYIYIGYKGILIYDFCENILVSHNQIEQFVAFGIEVYYYTYPVIEFNNINSTFGIFNTEYTGCNSIPEIHYNNLNCSNIAIKTYGNNQVYDIPAQNNYFYTTDLAFIETQLIWDYEDAAFGMQNSGLGHILFQPILLQEVTNAGIQLLDRKK